MGEFATFTDDFHNFMEECMERKNLRGRSQSEVQQELRDCVRAWNRVKEQTPIEDVDEEELARQFLGG